MRSWIVRDLEVQKIQLESLYHFQFCCEVRPRMRILYHSIMSFQSVQKIWYVKCWSMLSIAHRSASNSVGKAASRCLKFLVPISWIFPTLQLVVTLYLSTTGHSIENALYQFFLEKFYLYIFFWNKMPTIFLKKLTSSF